jgi:hypothetical protein
MPNMRREQEHLACADRNISDNSLFDHFQHHVPTQLVEELVSGIVVKIDPLVGSAYDLDDHTALIKERPRHSINTNALQRHDAMLLASRASALLPSIAGV